MPSLGGGHKAVSTLFLLARSPRDSSAYEGTKAGVYSPHVISVRQQICPTRERKEIEKREKREEKFRANLCSVVGGGRIPS
jgi:hypothetical protein